MPESNLILSFFLDFGFPLLNDTYVDSSHYYQQNYHTAIQFFSALSFTSYRNNIASQTYHTGCS